MTNRRSQKHPDASAPTLPRTPPRAYVRYAALAP